MRQQQAQARVWVSLLLVLFLCVAACMEGGMGLAVAAYSPTVLSNGQAGQPAPGSGGNGSSRGTASHGGIVPLQSMDLWQEDEYVRFLPEQDPGLPSLNVMACHAVRVLMYSRPLSELASRIGGHAPP